MYINHFYLAIAVANIVIIMMIMKEYYFMVMLLTSSSCYCQDDFEARLSKLEVAFKAREQDLEARVTKLEELIKIGTLRSCAEYSQYGLKTNDYYMIDPDGPLLGEPPFQVFCNFTSGK